MRSQAVDKTIAPNVLVIWLNCVKEAITRALAKMAFTHHIPQLISELQSKSLMVSAQQKLL
jgi:hypothetical protein